MQNKINDEISYINWSESPLSSDVIIIKGTENTWIYDVGQSDEAFDAISSIKGHKNIVLSHFHIDHIGNLKRIVDSCKDDITVYASKQTSKYVENAVIIENTLEIEDGIKFKIIPVPSSHAKGCLILEVDDKYAFLGDVIYPTYVDDKKEYNCQKLKSQIEVLSGLSADKLFLSHDTKPFIGKRVVTAFLASIYEKRNPQESKIIL